MKSPITTVTEPVTYYSIHKKPSLDPVTRRLILLHIVFPSVRFVVKLGPTKIQVHYFI